MSIDFQTAFNSRSFSRNQAEALIYLTGLIMADRPLIVPFNIAQLTWGNQPAAATPLLASAAGVRALPIDLSEKSQIRLTAMVATAGAATAKLQVRFASTAPTTSGSYASMGAECSLAATGLIDSGWVDIPAAYLADGYVEVFGVDGDGAADPAIGAVRVWIK